MDKKRLTAYFLLILTAAIWGVAGPVIKVTVALLPPFSFLFWRLLLTSIIFLPFFLWQVRKEKENFSSLLPIIPLGFLGIPLCLSFIFLGFERTSALEGSVIAVVTPILIVIAGVLFLKETITSLEKIGLAIAISGSVVMILQPILEDGTFSPQNSLGNLLVFLGNAVWATYVVLSKVELKKHSPLMITSVSFFTGLVAIFPLALLEQGEQLFNYQSLILNSGALGGLLYMTILSSVLAYFFFQWGVSLIEASEATLFAYLQPVFAAPVAIFWLGDKITPAFVIGALIILLGVFLTEYRPKLASST